MNENSFEERLVCLKNAYELAVSKKNVIVECGNGVVDRYVYPVLTARHVPLFWKYDLNRQTNPFLMERFGINAVFNSGAIKFNGKYLLMPRIEGADRKSFFAIAESDNGVDNFRFWDYPVVIPDIDCDETNIYDIRLTQHEDGWIYGLFCSERKDNSVSRTNQSAAIASCGIVRTQDLKNWQRFPNLITRSAQQRNVVLHPEFVHGKYALYTRPQDDFIEAGNGGGIAFALVDDIKNANVREEFVIDHRIYHTVNESKNGQGPAPIKTVEGWLHLAHGVRGTAAGLRYVLYCFITDINDPTRIRYKPGGYLLAPEHDERIGDVSNVLFSNGWICDDDGKIFIYYASSDTRLHVATTDVDRLLDYCKHTGRDGLRSAKSVDTLKQIIDKNMLMESSQNGRTSQDSPELLTNNSHHEKK